MLDDAFVTLYFLFIYFCFVFIFKMRSVMEPALIRLPRLTGQSTSRIICFCTLAPTSGVT